jgi:hypothetical protein
MLRLRPQSIASKHAIETDRISDADNAARRGAVETGAEVKIDLLLRCDAVCTAGIKKMAGAAMRRVVSDILDEEIGASADFLLDH